MSTYSLTISGVKVKAPKTFQPVIQDIDAKATRDAKALLHRDKIATKRKISISWGPLTLAECSTILKAVDHDFFSVTYLDPQVGGMTTKTFYTGDRTVPTYTWNSALGGYYWQSLSFDIIEK